MTAPASRRRAPSVVLAARARAGSSSSAGSRPRPLSSVAEDEGALEQEPLAGQLHMAAPSEFGERAGDGLPAAADHPRELRLRGPVPDEHAVVRLLALGGGQLAEFPGEPPEDVEEGQVA